jgi:hypothetical protein
MQIFVVSLLGREGSSEPDLERRSREFGSAPGAAIPRSVRELVMRGFQG